MNSQPEYRPGLSRGVLATLLLIALFIISSPLTKAADDSKEISHTYRFDSPIIGHVNIAGTGYDRVAIPGLALGGNPGEPMLPISGARMLIPAGFDPDEISVSYGKPQSLGRGYNIVPNGQPIPLSADSDAFEIAP